MLDCRDFNRVGSGMKNTHLYINFQGELQRWVYDVAAVITGAPEWDEAWLSPEWLDVSVDTVRLENDIIIRKPNL